MNIPFLDEVKSSVKAVVDAAKTEILTALQNNTSGVTAQTKKFTEFVQNSFIRGTTYSVNGQGLATVYCYNNYDTITIKVDGKSISVGMNLTTVNCLYFYFEKSFSVTVPNSAISVGVIIQS